MALVICPDCQRAVSDLAYECPNCGRPMDGPPLPPSQKPGARLTRDPAYPVLVRTEKNKGTATILALLLGGFGVHRFYLGKPVSGLFYLLFCFTFIPLVLGLVEFVQLVFMGDEEFRAKYALPRD